MTDLQNNPIETLAYLQQTFNNWSVEEFQISESDPQEVKDAYAGGINHGESNAYENSKEAVIKMFENNFRICAHQAASFRDQIISKFGISVGRMMMRTDGPKSFECLVFLPVDLRQNRDVRLAIIGESFDFEIKYTVENPEVNFDISFMDDVEVDHLMLKADGYFATFQPDNNNEDVTKSGAA